MEREMVYYNLPFDEALNILRRGKHSKAEYKLKEKPIPKTEISVEGKMRLNATKVGVRGQIKRYLDITGQRYDRLVAIEYIGSNSSRNALWKCRCDCGNEVIVSQTNLKNGKQRSCGCLRKDLLRERRNESENTENE